MPDHAADPPDGCPIETLLGILARAWTVHIVRALGRDGAIRFAELQRRMPGSVSARVLTVRLRELTALTVVVRRDAGGYPRRVDYALTDAGLRLDTLLRETERLARALPSPLSPSP